MVLIGIIGLVLGLAPFIGLTMDLIKSRNIVVFVGFFGVFILLGTIVLSIRDITLSTIAAFCATPVLFIYLFLMKYLNKSKEKKQGREEILDDE